MKTIVLPAIWIGSLAAVFMLTGSFKQKTTQFMGITDNREQSVSFKEPVEITAIHVIEGQKVEKGSVLLSAQRSELNAQSALLNNEMAEVKARQSESLANLNAEIRILRVRRSAELAQIDDEISRLQTSQERNRELFRRITGETSNANTNALHQQIAALQNKRRHAASAYQAEINALKVRLAAGLKPLEVQKKQIDQRLAELQRQSEQLTIRADFTGRIGSVHFKTGETVSSFQSVMTVHGISPRYVKGYIHENVSNDVRIGQQVYVYPVYDTGVQKVTGIVESLGSRIVEYPERLRKNSGIRAWGREVNIRLNKGNPLLLGEKVQISFNAVRPNSAESVLNPLVRYVEDWLPIAFAKHHEPELNIIVKDGE